MKRTFLRVVSMCLAVLMLAGAANLSVFAAQIDTGYNTKTLQSTVQAGVAKNGAVTVKTDGQIVAETYSEKLSDLEKAILNTGALLGETYQITTPADTCVTIDAETKTVTAEDCEIVPDVYKWVPVTATAVFVGGEVTKSFNGGKTVQFTAAEITADQYSIQVVYELKVTIDENTQKALLNAPVTLAGAVANMNIIKSLIANLNTLAESMEDLYAMTSDSPTGGYTIQGTSKGSIDSASALGQAITELYNDCAGNGGNTFALCVLLEDYSDANAVEFIIENGKDVHTLFDSMKKNLSIMAEYGEYSSVDGLPDVKGNLTTFVGIFPNLQNYIDMLDLAIGVLTKICESMDFVNEVYWSAYSNSPVKSGISDEELAALNAAVLNAVDKKELKAGVSFHDDIAIVNPIQIGAHTITKGVDQYKVIVDVVANVYKDSNATTTINGIMDHQLVLDKNLTPDQIEAAIEASGIIDASVAGWDSYFGFGVAGAYKITYSVLPDALTEDIDCTVTFVPQNIYTIDYDFATDEDVAYGYTFELPKHDDATKSYIYTVNGNKIFQGNKYRVTSDVTVTREEGKSLEVVTIPAFVADSYIPGATLTAKDKNILSAGGLICGTIAYARPENTDVTIEVEATDLLTNAYSVSATAYPTVVLVNGEAIDAEWVPTEVWVGNDKVADFTGTATSFTYGSEVSKVAVQYDLVIDPTYISLSEVKGWAELADVLSDDAASQASRLFKAVDLVSSDGFTKANNLAGSLAAIIDAGNYAQKTKDAAHKLNDECLNEKGKLKLADLLADYTGKSRSAMLANYYSGNNSVELNAQIAVLAEVFGDLSDDTEFLNYVNGIQAGAGDLFLEYKDKIADIRVPDVNANINRNATMLELTALADALLAEGTTTESVDVTTALTHRVAIEGVASNLVIINLSVTAAGKTFKDSMTFGKGETFTQDDINAISDKLNALKAQATQGIDLNYYNVVEATLPAVGETVTDYTTFATVYTPKTYTVVVNGVPSEITYNSTAMFIQLPRPSEGIVYRYTVGTKTYDIGYGQAAY